MFGFDWEILVKFGFGFLFFFFGYWIIIIDFDYRSGYIWYDEEFGVRGVLREVFCVEFS